MTPLYGHYRQRHECTQSRIESPLVAGYDVRSEGDNVTVRAERIGVTGESHHRDILVYVCHAYAARPSHSVGGVREICRRLVASGVVPLAPQLFFPQFLD